MRAVFMFDLDDLKKALATVREAADLLDREANTEGYSPFIAMRLGNLGTLACANLWFNLRWGTHERA